METKICTKCGVEKPLSDFYNRNDSGNTYSYCKDCFNEYCIQRWIDRKIQAIEYLGSKCSHCDISYPEYPYPVFDFHHIGDKDVQWNKLRLRSWDKIKKELDECILLCANCHRIVHSNVVHLTGLKPVT